MRNGDDWDWSISYEQLVDWRSLSNEGMECSETFWDLNYQFAAQILIYRYPYKNVTRKTSLIVT